MTIPLIDLKTQYRTLRQQIHERINRVLEHGQFIMGPEVQELEERLAAYTGSRYCITVSSGTEALLISLMALDIKAGDEVITTPFTFIATAEVIALLGARPVFIDIEPDTCNIDVKKIQEKITNKTKAIIPVSLYGQPPDMDEINAIAARNGNIPVIEDAAQSFGASYKGKKSCNLSTIGCTSFFPSKPLGCYGDGGAIFTNSNSIAQVCKEIRVHGQSSRYVHTRIGVGGRMDTLQCAILLAKLEQFDSEIKHRIDFGRNYTKILSTYGTFNSHHSKSILKSSLAIKPIVVRPDRTSVYGQYTLICSDRNTILDRLNQADIQTAIHYPVPVNEQPAYKNLCCDGCTPYASKIATQVISLPMAQNLTQIQQKEIIAQLFSGN